MKNVGVWLFETLEKINSFIYQQSLSNENLRGMGNKVMLRFNHWEKPEGYEEENLYEPQWNVEDKALAEKAGHGGGDFFVIKEFFDCIRENRRPLFDEHFATTCSSVAILSHRSALEKGIPYDIPDFRKEEDCVKYENDYLTPIPPSSDIYKVYCWETY